MSEAKPPYRNQAIADLAGVTHQHFEGSASARSVLLALLDLGAGVAPYGTASGDDPQAWRAHELTATWGAGVRTLAERSGLSRSMTQRSLEELQRSRHIVRVLRRGSAADVWAVGPALLRLYEELSDSGTINHRFLGLLSQNRIPDWPAHLLSGKHERIWRELDAEPVTVAALAARMGSKWETVKRHLSELAGCGLAAVTPKGWVRGPGSLADAAAQMDVDGVARRQAERHAAERDAWQAHITQPATAARDDSGFLFPALSEAEAAQIDAFMLAQTCPYCGAPYRRSSRAFLYDPVGGWWPEGRTPQFVRADAERAWRWFCSNPACTSGVLVTQSGIVYRHRPTRETRPDGLVVVRVRKMTPDARYQRQIIAQLPARELLNAEQLGATWPAYCWAS